LRLTGDLVCSVYHTTSPQADAAPPTASSGGDQSTAPPVVSSSNDALPAPIPPPDESEPYDVRRGAPLTLHMHLHAPTDADAMDPSVSGDGDGSSRTPKLRLHLQIPAAFKAGTSASVSRKLLCYGLAPTSVEPGVPQEGYPAALDASSVLKRLLAMHLPATAVLGAPISATGLSVSAQCRVWPHVHLTAAQSEARVHALVSRIKALTGYEATPPPPPLAHTRLGSAHLPHHAVPARRKVHAHASAAGGSPSSAYRTPGKAAGGELALAGHSSGRGAGPHTKSPDFTPLVLRSSSRSRNSITFGAATATATAGSLSFSPRATPLSLRGGGGRLASLALTPGQLGGAVALQAPRGLARFVSMHDKSRTGVSPASFDRLHHTAILTTLQVRSSLTHQ
jgi:hypothetical protein